MSYNSPSNDLDNDEIMSYLNMKDIGLGDWVKKIWRDGYEWGYQVGYEESNDG